MTPLLILLTPALGYLLAAACSWFTMKTVMLARDGMARPDAKNLFRPLSPDFTRGVLWLWSWIIWFAMWANAIAATFRVVALVLVLTGSV